MPDEPAAPDRGRVSLLTDAGFAWNVALAPSVNADTQRANAFETVRDSTLPSLQSWLVGEVD